MDSAEHTDVRRRVRLPIAAAVVATLTVAIAEAPAASSSPERAIPRLPAGPWSLHPVRGAGPQRGRSARSASTIAARSWGVHDAEGRSTACCATGAARITSFDVPGARGTEASDNQRSRPDRRHLQRRHADRERQRETARMTCSWRGEVTRIDFPGAAATTALGINNRGQVVGAYVDARRSRPTASCGTRAGSPPSTSPAPSCTAAHRHQRPRRDRRLFCDDPRSDRGTSARLSAQRWCLSRRSTRPARPFTLPPGINNRGQIVGIYSERRCPEPSPRVPAGQRHHGPFTPIDFPGAPQHRGVRHQRPRPDRRRLREPRCRAGRQPSPMQMPMMMSGG